LLDSNPTANQAGAMRIVTFIQDELIASVERALTLGGLSRRN
jgi:hypothetical protein